jgi:hypothetical protein
MMSDSDDRCLVYVRSLRGNEKGKPPGKGNNARHVLNNARTTTGQLSSEQIMAFAVSVSTTDSLCRCR